MNALGAHPGPNPIPPRTCGSFSFLGRGRALYFVWPIQNNWIAARIRSLVEGFATITFHPCEFGEEDGAPVLDIDIGVALANVPPFQRFRILNTETGLPVVPLHPGSYELPFGGPYSFFLEGVLWEKWGKQLQMWRHAYANGPHNIILG